MVMTSNDIESWNDIKGLKDDLLRGIFSIGFENPSPIQKKSILPFLTKKDLIAQAQSGTGKTGCFTVSTLQLIDNEVDKTQAIVLLPTRELASQVFNVFETIAGFMNVNIKLLIGGTNLKDDLLYLNKKQPHIIIGCPGRILDLMYKNYIYSDNINIVVIDEADEMFSYGFKEQIYKLLDKLNKDIQIALFSATIPDELHKLIDSFMKEPTKILVKADMLTLEGIAQYYIALENDYQKYETLKDLYESISISQCIIYCNSIKRIDILYEQMIKDEFPVCCIHSNIPKYEREESFKQFRNGKYRVLISSNVTARGIDIQQVNIVINYDVPKCIHSYLHRIGRSGRWGRKGNAINFVTKYDIKNMKTIEQYYQTEIKELPLDFVNS
jgi:translation initiation factor 4A